MLISHPIQGLTGTAAIPGDKSISHRALMFGTIAEGETTVTGLLTGEDVRATAGAMRAMGAVITEENDVWRIIGVGARGLQKPDAALYLGNSGTSTRLLMGLVAGYPIAATFTGDASLSRRPMRRVITPLTEMGAAIAAEGGDRLPLTVIGRRDLRAISYTLPVASAQLKSAIMLAALHAQGDTVITEPQPTRDHSERMLAHMGAQVSVDGAVVTVKGGAKLKGGKIDVPADPSSAAFLTVAALITEGSDLTLKGVLLNPRRHGIYDMLLEMGADIAFINQRDIGGETVADIRVKSSRLKGVAVPPDRVPSMIDEFPILSVAAAFAEGRTVMTDLAELRVKESDRLAAMAAGLAAAGVSVEMGEDSLTVTGGERPQGGCAIETKLDHRIAMSFLVMGMAAREAITIDDAETINTSFPGFAALMNGLGAKVSATR